MTVLVVDDLEFELRRSRRRRSVQVTVDRGGELVLSAPDDCSLRTMQDFVREKRFWIYTKLAEKEALRPSAATKQYVSGEGFPYLGRSYRLLLVKDQEVPVKLEHGRFRMRRVDASEGLTHMVSWYTAHALPWLRKRVELLRSRIQVEPSDVSVQDLGYRWGSCGKGGKLYFHWRSILLPPRVVEYVVAHELVHLHEPHHTPEFWTRVERAMPDFAQRKQWLAEHAVELVQV
ncbi:MAG: M48 family metallopeptidase [Myxococcales bacterium]|nr:M48 family metallopeptidase [Myxococcales bacterium]